MKRIIQIFISLTIVFSLCGCSLAGLDARGLISPPKANQNQQDIHRLMQSNDGSLSFIYPKSGDYRSAVIMKDFNNDGKDEALGFCTNSGGGINFLIMHQSEKHWEIISSFQNSGTQVNRVAFGDLDGDKKDEIIIGWGAPQSLTATISVFKYENGGITEYPLDHTYNEFVITDFNNDGINELFTSTIFIPSEEENGVDQNAVGRVFGFDERPVLEYSCMLQNGVSKYTSSNFAKISTNTNAVILESVLVNGDIITQVLNISKRELNSILSDEDAVKEYGYFFRPSSFPVLCQDIDDDGVIEFPKILVQTATTDTKASSTIFPVDWIKIGNKITDATIAKKTVVSTSGNFIFEYPDDMLISCYQVESNLYSINERIMDEDGNYLNDQKLFTIKIFTQAEWSKQPNDSEYVKIFEYQNNICAVSDNFESDSKIINTIKPIIE